MTEPSFDHDRIDVYRLSIEYVASSFAIAKELSGARHARGSALECVAIHDILRATEELNDDLDGKLKRSLRRIVSMLMRLIARSDVVAEPGTEYNTEVEYEYRDAEYEHEHEHDEGKEPEPEDARELPFVSELSG